MTAVIKTENLGKTYRGKKGKRVDALKDLNLEVHRGEVFGFLGPNGAGKSTTIKLLMGLIFPTTGRFIINDIEGKDIRYKNFVGYLPENPSFYDYLTGEELLIFVGRNYGMFSKELQNRAEELLNTLDLYEARHRPIRSYSKGMVQRIGLAQALIHDPDILIFDEPMSGLDPLGRILVKELILKLKERGKTIFMSTHILNDIEVLCDRVGIIVNGHLKRIINIEDLMTKGITGYSIIFNKISEGIKERLKQFGAIETGRLRYTVSKENLTDLMGIVKDDKDTDINLIEPQRKGLEELFKEVISEG
jgi:ABC-2 type transport system ATP-binding protein